MIIVGGSSSRDLAKELASILGCAYIQAASTRFPDGECYTRIDSEKLDSKIREQERGIEKITADIGKAVVANLKDGKEIDKSAVDELYAKITEAEKKIEELKAEKEALKEKKE